MTAPHDTPRTDERAGLSEGEVALRDLAEEATPGPWHGDAADGDVWMLGNRERICRTFSQAYHRDAPYIAAANPTAILDLLDRLAAAVARAEAVALSASKLLAMLDDFCDGCEPSRGCTGCEMLAAAEPIRAALAEVPTSAPTGEAS